MGTHELQQFLVPSACPTLILHYTLDERAVVLRIADCLGFKRTVRTTVVDNLPPPEREFGSIREGEQMGVGPQAVFEHFSHL